MSNQTPPSSLTDQTQPTSKTKQHSSILRKLSTSSRRSLSWIPGIQQQQPPHDSNKIKFSSLPSNNHSDNQTTTTTKNLIGKGVRNVARTVKKSLHQFDRPRSLNHHQPSSSESSNHQPPTTIRTRAVSTPLNFNNHQSNQSFSRSLDLSDQHDNYPIERSSTPPKSPNRLKKKIRPQSALEPFNPQNLTTTTTPLTTWHAQTQIGSLPMAATLLAAPSPPPIDHSTFLAIIPGQQPNPLPSLSLIPPPSSQHIQPPILTAISTRVEPPLSRRVSFSSSTNHNTSNGLKTSSSNSPDQHNPSGFTFIRTPSKKSLPPSPSPLLSSSWTEIVNGHPSSTSPIDNIQLKSTRPPLVSASTAISIVQSCVAEHGSIGDLDDVDQQAEDVVPQTPRKRKVNSVINEPYPTHNPPPSSKESAKGEEEEPQHKVARSTLEKPFSSLSSISLQTNGSKYTSTTSHPFNFLPLLNLKRSSSLKSRKTGSRKDRRKSPSNSLHHPRSPAQKQSHPQHSKHASSGSSSASEVWNFSVVSTVVGVVLIAVVLIGSTNLSGINYNGKSWLGNWIKKIV